MHAAPVEPPAPRTLRDRVLILGDRLRGMSTDSITTLHWRFLDEHAERFARDPRTVFMAKSVERLSADERAAIRSHGRALLADLDAL